MKKIAMFFVLGLLVVAASAQRGRVQTLVVDTLQGNNNQTLATIPLTGSYESAYISVTIDRLSTAAGGTLYLKAGMDAASALEVNAVNSPSVEFAANDTMTTTDVAAQYWNINITEPGARYYYIYGDGDANDTVKVTTRLLLK